MMEDTPDTVTLKLGRQADVAPLTLEQILRVEFDAERALYYQVFPDAPDGVDYDHAPDSFINDMRRYALGFLVSGTPVSTWRPQVFDDLSNAILNALKPHWKGDA